MVTNTQQNNKAQEVFIDELIENIPEKFSKQKTKQKIILSSKTILMNKKSITDDFDFLFYIQQQQQNSKQQNCNNKMGLF